MRYTPLRGTLSFALLALVLGCGKSAPDRMPDRPKLEGIDVTGTFEGHAGGAAFGAIVFVEVDDAGKDKAGGTTRDGMIEADGTFKATVPAGKFRVYVIDAQGRRKPMSVVTVSEQSRQITVGAK